MPSAKTISKNITGYPDYLDFNVLREVGLEHIRKLSGAVWTDHNLHDPGITILEVLCYALLDLGYRTNFPVPDLLARDKSKIHGEDQFFSAAEILSNNPLTGIDFRKLLLDIPGVHNAWLDIATEAEVDLYLDCPTGLLQTAPPTEHKIQLNGLYRVWIQPDPVRPQDQVGKNSVGDAPSLDRISTEARRRLHAHRNLCEDFLDIRFLQEEQIGICAHLELGPDQDAEDVLVDLFVHLRDWLSPQINYYTLTDLVQRGRSMEEIFAGRPLTSDSHGFVDTEELENLELRAELHASDIYREIQQITGVRAVRKLQLFNYIDSQVQTTGAEWCLPLTKGYFPVLAPELCTIVFYRDNAAFAPDMREVIERYTDRLGNIRKTKLRPYELDRPIPEGRQRNLGDYLSIQHDFPAVYGIGEGGLPDSAPPGRKAQALQLKGYLLFFDQLLANYAAQLAHARDLLAVRQKGDSLRTYFSGSVASVPGIEDLIRGGAFDQNGESLTGSGQKYRRGQVVVFPKGDAPSLSQHDPYAKYLHFSSPQQRDAVIRRLRLLFENEEFTVHAVEDPDACDLFRFEIELPLDLPGAAESLLLRSSAVFDSDTMARREGEALSFLGLSTDYYRTIDRQAKGEYSFELAYEPRPYAEILDALSENKNEALLRRDRFLSHLLARFAEDFTDYALIQLSADGKRRSLDQLVKDKQNVLADYPSISSNRGRGFDYTRKDALWDTDNVTGLENRIGALMGIADRNRRTLAPFEVYQQEEMHRYQLRDFQCRVLWENVCPVNSFKTFSQQVQAAAGDPANYIPVECDAYSRYGFALKSQDCTIAWHPATYPSAAIRDEKMAYLSRLYADLNRDETSDGISVRFDSTPQGHVFILEKTDDDGGDPHVLLQSAKAYNPDQAAHVAWYDFLPFARNFDHYLLIEEPEGRGYSVAVTDYDGIPVAQHPAYYQDRAVAEQLRNDIFNWVQAHDAGGTVYAVPGGWVWRYTDAGVLLLESAVPFNTQEQAVAALVHALDTGASADNWEIISTPEGQFSFVLVQRYPAGEDHDAYFQTLAVHPHRYDGEAENDTVWRRTLYALDPLHLYRHYQRMNHLAVRLLWEKEDQILLQGAVILNGPGQLLDELNRWYGLALHSANWRYDAEESRRVVLLDNSGRAVAVSPDTFVGEPEAKAYMQQMLLAATLREGSAKGQNVADARTFVLADADGDYLLTGLTWVETVRENKQQYWQALDAACSAGNLKAYDDAEETRFTVRLYHAGGRLLAESAPFADAVARDAALADWQEWFGGPGQQAMLEACPPVWRFFIPYQGKQALVSATDYGSREEAITLLKDTLELGMDAASYQVVPAEEGCQCSFILPKPGSTETLALHPFWYGDPAACQQYIDEFSALLAQHYLPYRLEWQDPSWHFEVEWERCDGVIEKAFTSTTPYQSVPEAKDGFTAWLDGIGDNLQVIEVALPDPPGDGIPGEKAYTVQAQNGGHLAIHPGRYGSEVDASEVLILLKAYLDRTNWSEPAGSCKKTENGQVDKASQSGASATDGLPYFFRLRKDDDLLACFVTNWTDTGLRDAALLVEQDLHCCRPETYTGADCDGYTVIKTDKRFIFRIKTGATIWWQSAQTFETAEEAWQAFHDLHVLILSLATDSDNYNTRCQDGVACYFWLPDPDKPDTPIARTEDFAPDADLRAAFEVRLLHARRFPLIPAGKGQYRFRINDPKKNTNRWLSALCYDKWQSALAAFEHFTALLPYRENYVPRDVPEQGLYGFNLWNAGLESAVTQTQHFMAEDEAWDALDRCLLEYGDTGSLIVWPEFKLGCRFGIRWVDAAFFLARSPQVYLQVEAREQALADLYHNIFCSGWGKHPCDSYWFHLERPLDCGRSYKRADVGSILKWNLDTGILRYQENLTDPCATNNPDWISVTAVIDLMAAARARSCYVEILEPGATDPDTACRALGLLDAGNTLIAVSTEYVPPQQWAAFREACIESAWQYPLVRRGEGFGFQLAETENVLLESAAVYASPWEASEAFCRLLELIRDRQHYAGTEDSDCGPFGISVVDHEKIRAFHPASYPDREQAQAAQERLVACLDAEGMHVVEHILLRPKTAEINDCTHLLLAACGECQQLDEGDDYLPGADPYSFWATVAIPHWGSRFRRVEFRTFLEKSLRLEAPAHVALRIGWLSVRQMAELEKAWRNWLNWQALGDGSCQRDQALCRLLKILQELRNRYPAVTLHDCDAPEDSGDFFLLDLAALPE